MTSRKIDEVALATLKEKANAVSMAEIKLARMQTDLSAHVAELLQSFDGIVIADYRICTSCGLVGKKVASPCSCEG